MAAKAAAKPKLGATATDVPSGPRLLNRELSWLDFNARVLELAAEDRLPLLDRVRFCAIFSSNLDEFFSVRVAGLLGQVDAGIPVRSADGLAPGETLAGIRRRVLKLSAAQSELWRADLTPALEGEGIAICRPDELAPDTSEELTDWFWTELYPILTPLAVGAGLPFPYISPLVLTLGVFVRDPETGDTRFACVNVPESLPRFLRVGKGLHFVALEDVIAHFLPRLFRGMEIVEHTSFRVTRDADFTVSDEADDLLEAVELELRRRRLGEIVRVEVESSASAALLQELREGLGVDPEQLYRVEAPLDLSALRQLAELDVPELKEEPWRPVAQGRLAGKEGRELLAEIRRADLLAHHPYEAFTSSVEAFVAAAASEPDVAALKTTVYRTNEGSPVAAALVDCAEQGKQSVCLLELKARFDERRNIEWSRKLERAGVHVVYGFPGLKIHAKIALLVRREEGGLRRYVHVGTGNYHATNAFIYEDLSLLTADEEIAADVADLFNYVTGFSRPAQFRRLLVGPTSLRPGIVDEIRRVRKAAAEGKRARIRLKVNALVDPDVIDELYAASQAGASVEIVSRGICALVPGVDGLSERISVRSVLGRFLEHSRLYVFEADGEASYWLGSADLMPRNLDSRIEVLVPIDDGRIRSELDSMLDALVGANDLAWELGPNGKWKRVRPKKDEKAKGAQELLMRRATLRARRSRRLRTAKKAK